MFKIQVLSSSIEIIMYIDKNIILIYPYVKVPFLYAYYLKFRLWKWNKITSATTFDQIRKINSRRNGSKRWILPFAPSVSPFAARMDLFEASPNQITGRAIANQNLLSRLTTRFVRFYIKYPTERLAFLTALPCSNGFEFLNKKGNIHEQVGMHGISQKVSTIQQFSAVKSAIGRNVHPSFPRAFKNNW